MFALFSSNPAWDSTIMIIVVWGIAIPVLVQVLVGLAQSASKKEARENRENWTWRDR